MSAEIYLSPTEKLALSNSGDDAANSLLALASGGALTAESCKWLTPEEVTSLEVSIKADKLQITTQNKPNLLALLAECKSSPITSPVSSRKAEEKPRTLSEEITEAATYARAGISKAFGNPWEQGYKEYIGGIRGVLGKLPGFEPASQADIADAVYQSREFNMRFITWLVWEAGRNTNSFDTSAKWSGMWPYLGEKTSFESVEEKRKVITAMLKWLGDSLKDPNIQAGWIESFLGEGLIKKGLIIAGGVAVTGVIAGVMVYKAGKWVLARALWAAGVAIASAIGSFTGKWVVLGAQGLRAGVNAVRNRRATTVGTPSAEAPWATSLRELDISKPLERVVHEGILRTMYNQEVSQWVRPGPELTNTDAIPKDYAEEVKSSIDPAKTAEYNNRVARYFDISTPPVRTGDTIKDTKAMGTWQASVEKAIRWEKDPTRWQRLRGAAPATGTAADLQARLRQAAVDAKTEKFTVGSNTFDINPTAKTALEEIRSIEEQIKLKEGELPALKEAQKALEARLKDEKKYAQARHDLTGIDAKILTEKSSWEDALTEAEKQKSIHGENSSEYKRARANAWRVEADYENLKSKKITDTTTKTTLESKYTEINRGLTVDSTGKLTDSITMQKLESKSPPEWVKEKMRLVDTEVTRLHTEINTRMASLHAMNGKVPNAWNKAGIDVTMPDGTRVRVSQLGALLENLGKAMVKK